MACVAFEGPKKNVFTVRMMENPASRSSKMTKKTIKKRILNIVRSVFIFSPQSYYKKVKCGKI